MNVTPDLWCLKDGRKKLEESMKRLSLDDSRVKSKNLINLGLDYLSAEKIKVKNELKKFDNDFNDVFNRMPNRNEKEVMRPLYIYYKNLKEAIDNKIKIKKNKKVGNKEIKEEIKDIPRDIIEKEIKIKETDYSSSGSLNFNSVFKHDNKDDRSNKFDKNEKEFKNKHNNSFTINTRLNTNLQQQQETQEVNKNRSNSHSYNQSKKIYSKSDILELEKELSKLKKEQLELKDRLHNYQKEFFEIHNRKIKYHKDILGVEREYQIYKNNKEKLKELITILSELKLK